MLAGLTSSNLLIILIMLHLSIIGRVHNLRGDFISTWCRRVVLLEADVRSLSRPESKFGRRSLQVSCTVIGSGTWLVTLFLGVVAVLACLLAERELVWSLVIQVRQILSAVTPCTWVVILSVNIDHGVSPGMHRGSCTLRDLRRKGI